MESSAYVDHLVVLVKEGKVKESLVDDAAHENAQSINQ
jgi:beta-glucosidase